MPMSARTALLAAALALIAVVPAQAFTLENGAATGDKQGYTDLDVRGLTTDKPAQSDDKKGEIRSGNFYMNFNNQRSFNQQYNNDNMFNPFYRDGR